MPKFSDIRKFTKSPSYQTDVCLHYFLDSIEKYRSEYALDDNPDFQRAHVWDRKKQIAFVEFILQGGQTGNIIYLNQPHWMHWKTFKWNDTNRMVVVDGKQRIKAITRFLKSEIPVFGYTFDKYEDPRWIRSISIKVMINDLVTRKEILQWYLDLNTGGVVHTSEEINKVKDLLAKEK